MGIRERVIRLLGGVTPLESAVMQADDYEILDGFSATDAGRPLREAGTFRSEFDQPYARKGTEKLGFHAFELREWTASQRLDIVTRCHQAWERNPLAKTGVFYTSTFTVGKGMTVSYRCKEVEEVIQAFIEEHEIEESGLESGLCDALQLDGEIFARFFIQAGKTAMLVVEPWEVNWIETERDNRRKIVAYHVDTLVGTGRPGEGTAGLEEPVPADEMLHVPINRLPYEMRGRPDLFPVLPWLKAYRDWLEERARLNRRKSLYYEVTLKNATSGQVSSKRNQYKEPPPPGSIVVHNENEKWDVLQSNIQAGEASEDGRSIKNMGIAGLALPEYFFASGSDANLATATAQALPPLRKFSSYQDILVNFWRKVFRKVLGNQVRAGLLAEEYQETDADGDPIEDDDGQPRMVRTLEAFDVRYPELEEKDPKTLAEALQLHVANAWCANETAAAKAGYDPRVEGKKMERERAAQEQSAAQREPVPGEGEEKPPETGGKQGPPTGEQPEKGEEEEGEEQELAGADSRP